MSSNGVSINVRLTPENNWILGIYKEYFGLSSKEDAINKIIEDNGEKFVENIFTDKFLNENKEIFEKMKRKKSTTIAELRTKYLSD